MPTTFPYFAWYPSDAEGDDFYASLTLEEIGLYHRCLNRSWMNGGIPASLDELSRLFKIPRKTIDRLWSRIGAKWTPSERDREMLVNPRQEIERQKAVAKSEHNKRPGNANAKKSRYERVSNVPQRAYDSDSSIKKQEELPSVAFDATIAFGELWAAYPSKGRVKKVLAMQYYCDEIRTGDAHAELMEALRGSWAASKKWADGYVLNLPEWIHNRCWEEEPEPAEGQKLKAAESPTVYDIMPWLHPNHPDYQGPKQ